jgi:hypothetical protein
VIVGALHVSETLAKFVDDAVAIALVTLWKFVVAVFDAVAAVAEMAPLMLGVTRNVYVVPASRPVTVAVVAVESGRTKVVQLLASLLYSTRYVVIPAVCDGAIQERATESIFPAAVVAVTVGTFTKTSNVIGFEVTVVPAAS